MGLPRATACRFGQGNFEAVFNFFFNSRRDQKRARQILGLRHDARNASSCFKSLPETMKPQKAGRMTQTSTCWTGEDRLWESKSIYLSNPKNRHQTNRTVQWHHLAHLAVSCRVVWSHKVGTLSTLSPLWIHGRPTWRDRFSNLNQAPFPGLWNHAEVKATSQIASRVVKKAPLLRRSGKYLICVCEGVVLRQCDLIIRTSVGVRNHLVQGELVFCEVVLHFASDSLHMTPACSWWSDYCEHIYVYSLLFWQDSVNFMALPIVVYIRQSAMHALVGRVIFIARPDGVRVAIDNDIYWSALDLDGGWAREAFEEKSGLQC